MLGGGLLLGWLRVFRKRNSTFINLFKKQNSRDVDEGIQGTCFGFDALRKLLPTSSTKPTRSSSTTTTSSAYFSQQQRTTEHQTTSSTTTTTTTTSSFYQLLQQSTTTTTQQLQLQTTSSQQQQLQLFTSQQQQLQVSASQQQPILISTIVILIVVIFIILVIYKYKHPKVQAHPPTVNFLLRALTALSEHVTQHHPNPSPATQTIISFINNTIFRLFPTQIQTSDSPDDSNNNTLTSNLSNDSHTSNIAMPQTPPIDSSLFNTPRHYSTSSSFSSSSSHVNIDDSSHSARYHRYNTRSTPPTLPPNLTAADVHRQN